MTLLLAILAFQGDAKTAQKAIQAHYDAIDQGFRKKNPAVFDGLMTNDFVAEPPDGKPLGKKEALGMFKGLLLGSEKSTWPRKVMKVRFVSPAWVATVDGHFSGLLQGPDGKIHRTELITTVEDTWVKTAAGWQIKRSHMVKMAMKRDGKAVGR